MSAMDVVTVDSVMTVVLFVVFVGICLWAYSGRRRESFERYARMALDDEAGAPREKEDG